LQVYRWGPQKKSKGDIRVAQREGRKVSLAGGKEGFTGEVSRPNLSFKADGTARERGRSEEER